MMGGMDHDHSGMMGGMDMSSEAAVDGSSFCMESMAMVMYMDGFHWSLKGESGCINLFFASWMLNSTGKFIGAMIGIILLGISTEAVSRLRRVVANRARNSTTEESLKYSLYQTSLHGLHALSGYLLMLAVMTFSLELVLSVILGLTIGFFRFGDVTLPTATPCCAFLENGNDSATTNDGASGAASGTDIGETELSHAAMNAALDDYGPCCTGESSIKGQKGNPNAGPTDLA